LATYSGPYRPMALRLANAFGAALRGLGIRVPRLDLRALLRATGIEDAHFDKALDAAFIDRLQVLLDDADGAARLNHVGRYVLRTRLSTMVASRLRVRQWLAEHPRTLDVPVERPLFIVGPPRSGTSLLYDLLAQDPQVRAPRLWEADSPVPPPVPDGGRDDPRYKRCARDLARLRKYAPNLAIAHELAVDAPHECFAFLEASAFSPTFLIYLHAPAYWKRLLAASDPDGPLSGHPSTRARAGPSREGDPPHDHHGGETVHRGRQAHDVHPRVRQGSPWCAHPRALCRS